MTNHWDILGLDGPTGDLKVIKRAYAKKLRVTRPDDDPQGFMALRDALENARFAAQYHFDDDYAVDDAELEPVTEDKSSSTDNKTPIAAETPEPAHTPVTSDQDITFTPIPEDQIIPDSHKPRTGSGDNIEDVLHSADPQESPDLNDVQPQAEPQVIDLTDYEQVTQAFENLVGDTFGRNETAKWTALFDDPRLDAIDTAIDFEDYVRSYFLDEFGYYAGDETRANRKRNPPLITTRVGTLIFNKMGWRETNGRPLYIQDQINWLRSDLDVINRDRPPAQVKKDVALANQYFDDDSQDDGMTFWQIAMIAFIVIQVARLIYRMSNG